MFYELLYPLSDHFVVFNLFRYITVRTFGALCTGLFIYLAFGKYWIYLLSTGNIRQNIREEGPASHQGKSGTPTMGGVLIVLGGLSSTLLWMDWHSPLVWLALAVFLSFGLVGFWDDYRKIVCGSNLGLKGRHKLLLQGLVALVAVIILYYPVGIDTQLSVPFFKNIKPDFGWGYIIFGVLVIVGASNAVNLTDGLDGLASVPSIIAFFTYALFAYLAGHIKIAGYLQIPYLPGAGELSIFCAAVGGACIGFLWFNTYPAEIFMGDVGSLPLGAGLGFVALATKNEILLVIVGGIFVLEAVSVMTQVVSFKLTGRRLFRMAPIHHHFELKGWQEPKVIVRFWIIAFILALISLSTLKLR